jgi:hypothetical protein
VAGEFDRDALAELVHAYGQRTEESRQHLLDAMEARGGEVAVGPLARSDDPADRLLAARLAHLLPSAGHLSALEPLVTDADPDVAAEARAALRTQVRDALWRELVVRLTSSSDPELAAEARSWQEEGRI